MSQYISFFVKPKDKDVFVEINSYSRNTPIYEALHPYVPFENISELTKTTFEAGITNLEDSKKSYKTAIKRLKNIIKGFYNNPNVVEAQEAIFTATQDLKEYKEELKIIKCAIQELTFIYDIGAIEDNKIYVGIEVGSPTVEDII